MAEALNRVQYTGLDFDTHEDDLRNQLQVNFASLYNDYAVSSAGIMLLDLIAYGLDTLSFYLDRRTADQYLMTARTAKAITRIARQLGYRVRGAVASSVDLAVTLTSSPAPLVTLPAGFQFATAEGLIFEVASDTVFTWAGVPVTLVVPCYEGVTTVENFVATGQPHQVVSLGRVTAGKFIADGSLRVTVGGAEWTEREFLEFSKTGIYESSVTADPPTITFGNGVLGNIPLAGASIDVTYVTTSGLAGQVAQGTITTVVTPLVVGGVTAGLTATNPSAAVGGDDPESADHVRVYAAKVYKSRKSAITREDYEALAGSFADPLFGRVAAAQALSIRSALGDSVVQDALLTIRQVLGAAVAPVTTAKADAATAQTDIAAQVAAITAALASIEGKITGILGGIAAARLELRSMATELGEINGDVGAIATEGALLNAAIDTAAATYGMSVADKDALKARVSTILARSAHIQSQAALASTAQGQADNDLQTANDQIVNPVDPADEIGATVADGYLKDIADAGTAITADVAVEAASWAVVQTYVLDADLAVDAECQAIYDHVDALLAADCKANLVLVPILVRNSSGFYAAPSVGLIKALQAYLDTRKEVTQTVAVVSGESALVEVSYQIEIGVRANMAIQRAVTTTEATVDSLLRGKAFGDDAYLKDTYVELDKIAGLGYATVRSVTTNPPGFVDADGNVIIPNSDKVLTRGTITITPVQLTW